MPDRSERPLLYYVRHGETDWNAERRFQGRRDIPLNATGRAQAQRNGRRLAETLEAGIDFDFLASPLARARETMEIMRAEMGLAREDYRTDERLVEAAYGDLEGVTLDEIRDFHPELWRERSERRWTFQPPGGESLAMTLSRVAPLIDGLARPTIIVAHGAVGRTVRRHLLDLEDDEAGWYEFPQDRVFRFSQGDEILL